MVDGNDGLRFNNYAAVFIDLLGQRNALRGCGLLPDQLEEFLPFARKSIGPIVSLHDDFRQFYESLQDQPDPSVVAPENREKYLRATKTALKFQRFSDGLVAYLSLAHDEDYFPINGVYSLIAASGSLCLLGLAKHQPLRGGLEIAWGAELNKDELYGCVVAKSYELESEIAKYPRIALGPEILGYFEKHVRLPGDDPDSQYIRGLAHICTRMITVADDGVPMIDYLGAGFKEYIANNVDDGLYAEATEFVESQVAHWGETGNEMLHTRYSQLKMYFENNKDNWVSP